MQNQNDFSRQNRLLVVITALAMVVAVVKAVLLGQQPLDLLATSDNDSIMRFLSVRAWLEGQPWHDMVQYRMLPPEGLDLHWSRYVDLGIAGIVWPLAQVIGLDGALSVAIAAWPTLLQLGLIAMTATAARRIFGPLVALCSVLALMAWPPAVPSYFSAGHLDHHNLQIVLATAMIVALLVHGHALRRGIIGGMSAALSLAVGLEMLPAIAAAGLILVASVTMRRDGADPALAGFGLSLMLGSILLFSLQTPASEWMVTRCDELSPPFLALTVLGAFLSLSSVLLAPRLPSVLWRSLFFVVASAIGLALVLPLLSPCAAGPYSSLPKEVQTLITSRINEARPILGAMMEGDPAALGYFVPTAATLGIASAMWLKKVFGSGQATGVIRHLGILLIFGYMGLIASLFQVRLIILGAGAVPLLLGLVLASLMGQAQQSPRRRLACLPVAAFILLAPALISQVNGPWGGANASDNGTARFVDAAVCRNPARLRSLDSVPPGVILSSSNLGPPLLLLTEHSVLAGPYHRSIQAMADGALPFDGDESVMRDALARTGADYLLLCRNAAYGTGKSFATALAAGQSAQGLVPVVGPDPALVLLRVTDP